MERGLPRRTKAIFVYKAPISMPMMDWDDTIASSRADTMVVKTINPVILDTDLISLCKEGFRRERQGVCGFYDVVILHDLRDSSVCTGKQIGRTKSVSEIV